MGRVRHFPSQRGHAESWLAALYHAKSACRSAVVLYFTLDKAAQAYWGDGSPEAAALLFAEVSMVHPPTLQCTICHHCCSSLLCRVALPCRSLSRGLDIVRTSSLQVVNSPLLVKSP